MSRKLYYRPPVCEALPALCRDLLATSFNGDNGTEYFDYEDGGGF